VHVITEGPLGWSALRAARKLDIPVVSDFHANFHDYSRDYGFGWIAGLSTGYEHLPRTCNLSIGNLFRHPLGFAKITCIIL